ncbi:transcriptional repressor [Bacillus cereus]|uniref:helix-turn-helix domain-containing protein n=1 Tax=Bacillus cereus group TaxID=86661 RepID=UPI001F386DF2|nr:helix-turn-helix transcriptional regulator [Bacillus cereus]MCU5716039.1 helix-turn-helix domain-containing protein [Bacillus cereus]MDA1842774.1 helix-turn-helix transcriptional regulator [Bacillus cereus]BCB36127.1 transcriptional repressor [Bacillus cereus]BCB98938.1 transcriptional repressor [Bacillus cereus]BCC22436.1 transcriptional repressor [Bacillus cereus]
MIFSERLKEEREKRNWSQSDLAEKIHVSRQSVSKWETGKNYPSIEIIIHLSDLFGITIDELLSSDEELTQKVIEDSKQLAYPKWKVFFDSLFMVGVFLFLTKIVVWTLNKFAGASITILADAPYVMSFLPFIFMVIGGTASDKLKNMYR